MMRCLAACLSILLLAAPGAAPEISDAYFTCRIFGHHVGYLRLDLHAKTDKKEPRQAYAVELLDVRDFNVLGVPVWESHLWKARLAADLSLVSFDCENRTRTSAGFPETRLVLTGRFDPRGRGRLETNAPSGMDVDAGGPLYLYDLLPLLSQSCSVRALRPYTASVVPATLTVSGTGHVNIAAAYMESPLEVERDASGAPTRLVVHEDLFRYEWKREGKAAATEAPKTLSEAEQSAVMQKMAAGGIVPNRPIAEPERTRRLHFYLHFPRDAAPIPSGLHQVVKPVDWNSAEIGIAARRLDPATGDLSAWLAPDLFANSEHPEIKKAAREAIKGATGDVEKAARLTHYVHQKVEFELSPGIPVASVALRGGAGDCTEHSTVYAALARAAGLPCRIAAGLVYRDGHFHYHAWNEVAVKTGDGSFWLPQDPSLGLSEVDATHIKLVEGNVDRQIALGPLLGKLKIDILEAQ